MQSLSHEICPVVGVMARTRVELVAKAFRHLDAMILYLVVVPTLSTGLTIDELFGHFQHWIRFLCSL